MQNNILKEGELIKVSIEGCNSHIYSVESINGKGVNLKLDPFEKTPSGNHASFWIPISALGNIHYKNQIKIFTIKEWFLKRASRYILIQLGLKI